MAFTNRKQMTPGLKACKDLYSGKKSEKKEVKVKDTPPKRK